MKKILVCGSHFTVAQAVIEQMVQIAGVEVEYVGRATTMEGDKSLSVESQTVPGLGIKYHTLDAGRVSRSLSWQAIVSLLKIPLGFVQAGVLIRSVKPDLVLSFGGYVSVPIVIMAKLSGTKVMLHEQTLVTGLSNRVCGWFADRIAVSFAEGNYEFDKKKMVITGNPIREELLGDRKVSDLVSDFVRRAHESKRKIIFITGGNQGAQAINQTIEKALVELVGIGMLIWQTGDSKHKNFENAINAVRVAKCEDRVLVARWFNASDIGYIFRKADLVVSRGGINTLNELAYFKQHAVVIPYPYLYRNEQLVNARYFEKLGMVKVILQSELTSNRLVGLVKEEINSKRVIDFVPNEHAASRVKDEALELLKI